MKIARQNEVEEFKEGNMVAHEYLLYDNDINVAVVSLKGRYPSVGKVINEKSKEVAYVVEGEVKLTVEDKECFLKKGDTVLIEPREHFWWEGNTTFLIPCAPAWTLE